MADIKGGFDFSKMIKSLDESVGRVQQYLKDLEESQGSSVDLSAMFKMQFAMQMMSQRTETLSNTLTAAHQLMMSMAKATKGQ